MENMVSFKRGRQHLRRGRRHGTTSHARESQRLPMQGPVFYTGLKGQGRGLLIDLSAHGCRVQGDLPVKPGDKLSLVIPDPTTGKLIIVDKGRVAWVNGKEFGLAYEVVCPSDRHHLMTLLARPSIAAI